MRAGTDGAQLRVRGDWARTAGGGGRQLRDDSSSPSISADGRLVAFASDAPNAVPADTNGQSDIFVRDRALRSTTRVSVSSSGAQANERSFRPAISADGRYVAFVSVASNLVSADQGGTWDVFLHDLQTRQTIRVGRARHDVIHPSVSGDGRYVVYDAPGDVIAIFYRETGTTSQVSARPATLGVGSYEFPAISADGRFVAYLFFTEPYFTFGDCEDDASRCELILVYNRVEGTSSRAAVSYSGQQTHSISTRQAVSADGRYVAFLAGEELAPEDTNNTIEDIYVHDRATGRTTLVSISDSGKAGNSISLRPSISGDGRYVAFESWATNLVPHDTNRDCRDQDGLRFNCPDVFVRDVVARRTILVSVSSTGNQARGGSGETSISTDGRYVAFQSSASNLVPGDTNGKGDIFVRDLKTGRTERVSVAG